MSSVDPGDYQAYTWEDWAKLRPAEGQRFIRAVRFRLRVPEVITVTDYDRLPAATVSFSRRNIFKRDHYTCQYCGDRGSSQLGEGSRSGKSIDNSIPHYQGNRPRRQPGMEELTLDHVIPRAQGGVSRWDNCVLACLECNKRKADRTPEQAKMRLKRKPVQPGWNLLYAIHQQRIEYGKRPFAGCVLVSDNESWVGAGRYGSSGVITEWQKFVANQQRLGVSSPKLVCIDIQPYGSTQAPDRDDLLNIGGFNDAVYQVVASYMADDAGRFVAEVASIEV